MIAAHRLRVALAATALCAAGCGEASPDPGPGASRCEPGKVRFASEVIAHEFGSGQDFGQEEFPEPVLGGPRGSGCCAGSLDVTSLGEGGFVVLGFGDAAIVDAPGADFIVFENPFVPSGGAAEDVFAEPGSVSVSQDGQTFHAFECTATAPPFGDCAGHNPVLANVGEDGELEFAADQAGGDAFDLAKLGLEFARFVRIEDRADLEGTFDLDAVAAVHAGCE